MEFNHNGIIYQINVSQDECDRRVGHLLAAFCRSLPAPADGAETQSDRSRGSAPANPSRPRYPVRVTVLNRRTGTSFLPCDTGGEQADLPARKGDSLIQFSELEYGEATTKRPPGTEPGGHRTTCGKPKRLPPTV